MSFYRGQEIAWNKIALSMQNLYRFSLVSLIFSSASFFVALHLIGGSDLWLDGVNTVQTICKIMIQKKSFGPDYFWMGVEHFISIHRVPLQISTLVFWISFLLVSVILYRNFSDFGKELYTDQHLRGTKLLNKHELEREILGQIQSEIREIRTDAGVPFWATFGLKEHNFFGKPFCPTACGLRIPEDCLSKHMAAIGSSGVGKSTLIKHKIEHSYKTGRKGIVLDFGGELYRDLGRDDDIILSLFDKRTSFWDFSCEKRRGQPIDSGLIASYIVPKSDKENEFFSNGARQVLASLISTLKTAKAISEAKNSAGGFQKHFSDFNKNITGKSGEGQERGIIGTFAQYLKFTDHLNYWPENLGNTTPISLFEWAQNDDPRWIYITVNQTDLEASETLIRLWFNLAIAGLMEREPDNHLPPISIIIDELNALGPLETLPHVVNISRKYGGEGFFGVQTESQFLSLYGNSLGRQIQNGIQTKWIFRVSDPLETKHLSELLGSKEYLQKTKSTSYGVSDFNDRETLGESTTERQVVIPSEISTLPAGHCYLKLPGLSPYKTRIIKKKWTDPASKRSTYSQAAEKPAFDPERTSLSVQGPKDPIHHQGAEDSGQETNSQTDLSQTESAAKAARSNWEVVFKK